MQALASGGRRDVSSNDAVTALVWVLMCGLRGRPQPGAAHPAAAAGAAADGAGGASGSERSDVHGGNQPAVPPTGGCLAMAVDLRRNFLSDTLPYSYFGMASWCLHVTGTDPLEAVVASGTDQQGQHSAAVNSGFGLRGDGRTTRREEEEEEEEGQGHKQQQDSGGAGSEAALVAALRQGAGRIRDTLTALRRGPVGPAGQLEGGEGCGGAGGRDGDGVGVGAALLDLIGEQLSAPARLAHHSFHVLTSTLEITLRQCTAPCPESRLQHLHVCQQKRSLRVLQSSTAPHP